MAWDSPYASYPIEATVCVPGSKSLTNRYLILASLGEETAIIRHRLVARDTLLMGQALKSMGIAFSDDISPRVCDNEELPRRANASHSFRTDDKDEEVEEENSPSRTYSALSLTPSPLHGACVNVGLAGTVMRFLPAIAGFAQGDVQMDGDAAARLRPIAPIVTALEHLGVEVTYATNTAGQATLPLTVHGCGSVEGGKVEIDASASSQFISALLLSAPRMNTGIDLRHIGPSLPSQPHIDMTVKILRDSGIRVDTFDIEGNLSSGDSPCVRWIVHPGIPHVGDVTVEPDLSNAGPFIAAAMVTGGSVRVENWPLYTTQAGDSYRHIFTSMGAICSFQPEYSERRKHATLHVQAPRKLDPIDIDMHDVGELVPTVAAVALFAEGTSFLRHIGHLRGHETDRLAALTTEINRLGGKARIENDDLIITPQPLSAATLESYADHRMATFGAIVGLRVPGVCVSDIATTAKTFPQFERMWHELAQGKKTVAPDSLSFDPTGKMPA